MIINETTTNVFREGLLSVWTNNPRIITSSLYNNSVAFEEFLNRKVIKKATNIFLTNIERFLISIEATKNFVSTKTLEIKKSVAKCFFETPKLDLCAVYRKAQGRTKEELRILPKAENQVALEKIVELDIFELTTLFGQTQSLPNIAMRFSEDYSLDQILQIGDENDTLHLPLSREVLGNPVNIARVKRFCSEKGSTKEPQVLESLLKELEELTLNEVAESNIIQKMIQRNKQKNETINARLKKFSTLQTSLTPLPPFTRMEENSLKKDLDNCTVCWLEKKIDSLSKVLKLDPVELSNMIQDTNKLKGKDLKTKNKIIINEFFTNLNKLERLIMDKQIYDKRKMDELNTTYKNYIESHRLFLKESLNKKPEKIEKLMVKISAKLTKCLAEIEYNLS